MSLYGTWLCRTTSQVFLQLQPCFGGGTREGDSVGGNVNDVITPGWEAGGDDDSASAGIVKVAIATATTHTAMMDFMLARNKILLTEHLVRFKRRLCTE